MGLTAWAWRPGGASYVNDAAGGQKRVRLVERMRDDMEERRGKGAKTAFQHHEAHLRDRGIGERHFDGRLRQHHRRTEYRGDGADDGQRLERGRDSAMTGANRSTRKPPALMMPAWRSAETGVGVSITSRSQPCSGNCADFSIAAQRQKKRGGIDRRRAARGRGGKYGRIVQSAERVIQARHRPDQAEVAESAREKFLARGEHRRLPFGIEEEQAMQADAGGDPGERELEEIARDDEGQNRRQRQAKPLDETLLTGIAAEIVAAVGDNDRADERDEGEHRGAEHVQIDGEADARDSRTSEF